MQGNREEYILVLGATGSGKSTFINDVSNSTLKTSDSLHSCTFQVNFSEPIVVDDCKVILFDTPGFDDTSKQDVEILTELSVFLGGFYEQRQKLIGVLYLHDITNSRMGGTAVRNVRMFNRLVGETAAKNVLILTTKWDIVEPNIGEKRHRELAEDPNFFGTIIQQGAKMWKYSRNDNPLTVVHHILTNHRRTNIKLVEELESGTPIGETGAGKVLREDIDAALKNMEEKHKEQMRKMEGQFKAQMEADIKRATEELTQKYEKQIKGLKGNQTALKAANKEQMNKIADLEKSHQVDKAAFQQEIAHMKSSTEQQVQALKDSNKALERSLSEAKKSSILGQLISGATGGLVSGFMRRW